MPDTIPRVALTLMRRRHTLTGSERVPYLRGAAKATFSSSASSNGSSRFLLSNDIRHALQEDQARQNFRRSEVLRMLMFGKPGAGKGTLTARLVNKYDVLSVSAGDLLRGHIQKRTEIGVQAERIVASGGLVPDEVMVKVVTNTLDGLQNKHWILDGFPRTIVQAKLFDVHLKKQGTPINLVVNLDVPDDIILSRISDRWVHLPSGRIYNISYNPPKVPGFDDVTGELLTKRPDDNPETFARRLRTFYESTSPLLAHYSDLSRHSLLQSARRYPHQHPHQLSFPVRPAHRLILSNLTGNTSDEIWPKLDALVRESFPAVRERAKTIENTARHSLSDVFMTKSRSVLTAQDRD